MSKIGNIGITGKRGFRYTCYFATATQNLKDLRNAIVYGHAYILWTY